MSRYTDSFEILATRGTARGAEALLERAALELEDQPVTSTPLGPASGPFLSRRLFSPGPLVAVVVFLVVVVVVAVAWLASSRQGTEDTTDPFDDLSWSVTPFDARLAIGAGPGGFVALASPREPEPHVQFSSDAITWSAVALPVSDPELVSAWEVVATDTTWLVQGARRDPAPAGDDDRAVLWSSPDGTTWSSVEIPEEVAGRIGQVVPGPDGFLVTLQDPFDEVSEDLWHWAQDRGWEPVATTGLPELSRQWLTGGSSGFVMLVQPEEELSRVFWSATGHNWVEGSLEGADSSTILLTAEWVGDRWLALGSPSGDEDLGWQAWSSVDGLDWLELPQPAFDAPYDGINGFPWNLHPVDGGLLAQIVNFDSDGESSTTSVWATTDGESWQLKRDFGSLIVTFAVGRIESDLVAVWSGSEPVPGGSSSSSTIPPAELDPRGVAIQDAILDDGRVTRDELESAAAGMQRCMEEKGLVFEWSIGDDGSFSASVSGFANEGSVEEAEQYCTASYLQRVLLAHPGG